ncbi:MAG: hypothetical protein L0287_29545, partial [Anaerolineae bacterium]|nr:hypothetical protein [Anaerolineae bacterium]
LMIANLAAGSVHAFVDMPAASAFKLKTLALNREKRFKQIGITSLRIGGDSKFVNITLGALTATATIGLLNLLWLSLPSLFPSLFGVTVGKVILVTTLVTATTAVGVEVVTHPDLVPFIPIKISSPTVTATVFPTEMPTVTFTFSLPPTETLEPSYTPSETIAPTLTPTFTSSATDTPTSTFTLTPTFTPSATDTLTSTPTPSETITPSPTQVPLVNPYIRGVGDYSCPGGYTLATYSDAVNDTDLICSALDTWDIARLAVGGSFDGPGYGCGFRSFDERSFGHSVCKPGSSVPTFTRGIGDYSCPIGYTLATYAEATDYADQICSVLDTWDIARLGDGGSFDGPGYGCGFRSFDERSLGHSVCIQVP